ncbi:FKBP-type peptidyl-prolyl cis-trans isomerase [Allokutzneria sp. A3M-2-11 16]|uniref:FKBP-type peptidyl-prolyl cis-trans isomerase n=1 Tax=Allokutzneria sp. A3M-2-11 16 TaxID=2962043 RepID=UPI0020B84627|nr:FKBP-type peptidyl-prolyl cis-trans isomerase [Allokutzneria sp. A3M-2-11 16]MCP3803543.1 FKBP-type peptidyl-prolyl cis-trans isomerase [Allokutzneria sp. A3M-2-11 16]
MSLLAGCSPPAEAPSDLPDGGASLGTTRPSPTRPRQSAPPITPAGPVCSTAEISVRLNGSDRPSITVPSGCAPPANLATKNLSPGSRSSFVGRGTAVRMHYALATWSDRRELESSFGGEPVSFVVGDNTGIPGWHEGVIGMSTGEMRLVVVPPAKGYGARGQQEIKANETLVFVLSVVQVG